MLVATEPRASDRFFSELEKVVNQKLGSVLKARIVPVEFSGAGSFNWYHKNTKGFNLLTWDLISKRVGPSKNIEGGVELIDAFPIAYEQVYAGIFSALCAKDQEKLDNAEETAHIQADAVVGQYEQTIEGITSEMMEEAGVKTKIDYVMYVVCTDWANPDKPITWTELRTSKNIRRLLPRMPASGEVILPFLTKYLNALGPSSAIGDQRQLLTWVLDRVQVNTSEPDAHNGGVPAVDPNHPGVRVDGKMLLAYKLPSVQEIKRFLDNKKQSIDLNMVVQHDGHGGYSLSINQGAAFSVGRFINVSGSATGEFDMLTQAGEFDRLVVTMSYPGFGAVSIEPMPWNQSTDKGWFNPAPIQQAIANIGQDVTGYQFASETPPPFDFKEGGDFGLLQGLVISNYPVIKMVYEHGDYQRLQERFHAKAGIKVKLFGLFPIGQASMEIFQSEVQHDAKSGAVTVSFTPSPAVVSVPDLEKTAYIIGGTVKYLAK